MEGDIPCPPAKLGLRPYIRDFYDELFRRRKSMKRIALVSALAVMALAGCTSEPGYLLSKPGLDEKDRTLLKETHDLAQEAKTAAAQAATDAKAAKDAADKATADAARAKTDAAAANAKVDHMLQASQDR
jgi:hypothetical protein